MEECRVTLIRADGAVLSGKGAAGDIEWPSMNDEIFSTSGFPR